MTEGETALRDVVERHIGRIVRLQGAMKPIREAIHDFDRDIASNLDVLIDEAQDIIDEAKQLASYLSA